jgi:hypothetical protein
VFLDFVETFIFASEDEYFDGDRPKRDFHDCIGLHVINL